MLYDISLPLHPSLPVWPGDPPLRLERLAQMDRGDPANVSFWAATVHVGTHIDAPDHFLNNGVTVEQLPLERFLGPAWVLDVPHHVTRITRAVLEDLPWPEEPVARVLFRTRNSLWWRQGLQHFRQDYVALDPDAAQALVARGVELVGIDYLSIAPFEDPTPTHRVLLEAGVVILEGLRLDHVPPGRYILACFPLALQGAEGAPVRAVLWKPEAFPLPRS